MRLKFTKEGSSLSSYDPENPDGFRALEHGEKSQVLANFLVEESSRVAREADAENDALKRLYAGHIKTFFGNSEMFNLAIQVERAKGNDLLDGTKKLSDIYDFNDEQVQSELKEELGTTLMRTYRALSEQSVEDGEIVFQVESEYPSIVIKAKSKQGDEVTYTYVYTGVACAVIAAQTLLTGTRRAKAISREELFEKLGSNGGTIHFTEGDHDPTDYLLYLIDGGFNNVPVNKMSEGMLQQYLSSDKGDESAK